VGAALIITALCGLVEVAVQQNYRQNANDPQIEFSEDIARALHDGAPTENVVPPYKVDIAQALGIFVILYDEDGKPLASSAVLNGQTPVVPIGVLQYAKSHGQNRLTWEPQKNVRSAVVVTPFTGKTSGYVVVGRSLREVEKRESQLLTRVAMVWLGCLAVLLVTANLSSAASKR